MEPLRKFRHLRELWITLRFIKTYDDFVLDWDPEGDRLAEAAVYFAERLPQLERIAFSLRPPGMENIIVRRARWHPMIFCRDPEGGLPKVFEARHSDQGFVINMLDQERW